MIVLIDKAFTKDAQQIRDFRVRKRVASCIKQVKQADSSEQIKSLKRLKGQTSYYRIRLGDYRLGIKIEGDQVIFIRILHRKDIYRYFPY